MNKTSLLAAALTGMALLPAHAATVIAQYDMGTLTIAGTTSTSPDVAANPDVTAGDFTENLTGGTLQGEFGIANSSPIPAGANGLSARSMNGTPSNPWWEFTVTPQGGNTVTLVTLTLDAGLGTSLGGTFRWDYDVSTSIDSFASTAGTFTGPTVSGAVSGTLMTATATGISVDLSALPAQTSPFTIRIAPNRVSGTNGATSQRAGWIDNVTLSATITPVPEPASLALGALGLLGLARRRR